MAEILYCKKTTIDAESFCEIKVWAVPKSSAFPEGIKYSLSIIEEGRRVMGYDNAHGDGHHKHVMGVKEAFRFTSLDALFRIFDRDVEEYIRIKKR